MIASLDLLKEGFSYTKRTRLIRAFRVQHLDCVTFMNYKQLKSLVTFNSRGLLCFYKRKNHLCLLIIPKDLTLHKIIIITMQIKDTSVQYAKQSRLQHFTQTKSYRSATILGQVYSYSKTN